MPTAKRDFIGYGPQPPDPRWPGNARLALNFVVNYEEGAEYCVLDGDAHSETMLSELGSQAALVGQRNLNIESSYEYGSRAGVWRILRVFAERDMPLTVYGVGLALERNPAVGELIAERGYDIVAHGWRWIDYQDVPEAVEREHIERCVDTIERVTRQRPLGWFTGRPSVNTRRLSLRLRRNQRRPSLLGNRWRPATPRYLPHLRYERRTLQPRPGIL